MGILTALIMAANYANDKPGDLTVRTLSYSIWISNRLKLCIAIAIHNFKWLKITRICVI